MIDYIRHIMEEFGWLAGEFRKSGIKGKFIILCAIPLIIAFLFSISIGILLYYIADYLHGWRIRIFGEYDDSWYYEEEESDYYED